MTAPVDPNCWLCRERRAGRLPALPDFCGYRHPRELPDGRTFDVDTLATSAPVVDGHIVGRCDEHAEVGT